MCLLLGGAGATALAQDLATEEIVVRSNKESEAQQTAPTAFVTSIDTEQHAEELETVTDALAETIGVQVRRYGGLGAFSTVSIRGSSSNQVQIYLDGIPMSRARNETVNLADLPIDSLERIDVYRGTVPLAFGAAAIGGVVNLVTRPPSPEAEASGSASYGSFDTRKVVGSYSQQVHGISVLSHTTYLGSEGDFPYFNGSINGGEESAHQKRENNAFNSVSNLLKATCDTPWRGLLELTADSFFKEEGVPGPGDRQWSNPSFREWRSTSYLRWSQFGLVGGDIDSQATLFGTYLDEQFKDPDRETGGGQQNRDDVTTQVGGNLTGTWRIFPLAAVSWFGEASNEQFDGHDDGRKADRENDPTQTRTRITLGIQDVTELFDRLTIVPTLRYEYLEDEGSEFSRLGMPTGPIRTEHNLLNPAIGAELRLFDWWQVRGNLAETKRPASFGELYGHRGAVQGNPDLKPEKGITRDIGFLMQGSPFPWLSRARLEYAYFNNDIDDIIVLDRIPGPNPIRAKNLASARVRGHEVGLALTAFDDFQFDANYTWQDAENRDPNPNYVGKRLPGRPEDELYTRVQWSQPRGHVYYEINAIGKSYPTVDNYARFGIDSRLIHTAGIKLIVRDWLSVSFEARNLGNDQAEDVYNYPLPGRSFFGTIEVGYGGTG